MFGDFNLSTRYERRSLIGAWLPIKTSQHHPFGVE